MTCQDVIDVMDERLEDRLEPGIRRDFEVHMKTCRPCSAYFHQLQLTREVLRHLSSESGDDRRRQDLIDRFKRSSDQR